LRFKEVAGGRGDADNDKRLSAFWKGDAESSFSGLEEEARVGLICFLIPTAGARGSIDALIWDTSGYDVPMAVLCFCDIWMGEGGGGI
jgi:hypothetical protein